MCGIAGFHVKDASFVKKHEGVELFANELLKGIEHRGKHATGFVAIGFDGKVVLDKAPKEASEFIKDRDSIPEGVRTVLLHTRHATLGGKEFQENNHPVVFGSCFVTHNGHINNHSELYRELSLTRNAEVDSSVIAAAAEFHGIGEMDDIRATLQSLEGAMACAIVNPVTHPGRVVLAKGAGSPLYIVDTPKFLVWGSTTTAIKDAWGKVFGTPPSAKKIECINEGNFIVVDDGDVTREKYTVKRRPFEERRSTNHQGMNGSTDGTNGSGFGFGKRPSTVEATPVVQAKDAIKEFIKAGGTARHFDAHKNDQYTEEDFKDITGDRRWHPCYGCNRLVLEQDRVKSDWGTICCDCYTATKREIAKAQSEMQDDVLAGTSIPRISPGDRDALEVWADYEQGMHRTIIELISKDCGSYYSPEAIEFLCFYTSADYREVAGERVNALIDELREAYQLEYLSIQSAGWPIRDTNEVVACEVNIAEGHHPLLLEAGAWNGRFCYEHNRTFDPKEGCAECEEEARMEGEARLAAMLDGGLEDEPEETEGIYLPFERGRDSLITRAKRTYTRSSIGTKGSEDGNADDDENGEVIELPLCGKCNTYVLRATESGCVVCRESEKADGKHEKASCLACKAVDPSFIVEYKNKKFHYCESCYSSCGSLVKGETENTVSLCNKETNHMLKDGVRVCHKHARKQ